MLRTKTLKMLVDGSIASMAADVNLHDIGVPAETEAIRHC